MKIIEDAKGSLFVFITKFARVKGWAKGDHLELKDAGKNKGILKKVKE